MADRRDVTGVLLGWSSPLLTFLASLLWGTSFVAIRFAVRSIEPLTFGFLRAVVASATLLVLARIAGAPLPARADLRGIVWTGVYLTGFSAALLIVGFQYVSPGLGAVIVNAMPLFLVPLAAVMLHERPTRFELLGLVISSLGLLVVSIPSIAGPANPIGVVLLLAAALTGALGSVMHKRYPVTRSHRGMAMSAQLAISSVLIAAIALVLGRLSWPAKVDIGLTVAVLWSSIPGVAIAFVVWAELLRRGSSISAATSLLLTPVVAGVAGLLLLGESMSLIEVIGSAIVLGGVVLIGQRTAVEPPR